MLAWLEVAELLGEDGERTRDRGGDDVVPDIHSSRLCHETSPFWTFDSSMVCA
jgi:hypothetical protein